MDFMLKDRIYINLKRIINSLKSQMLICKFILKQVSTRIKKSFHLSIH